MLLSLGVLVAVAALARLALPPIVAGLARDALARAGFPAARITGVGIAVGRVTISELVLAPQAGLAVKDIEAGVSLAGLLGGRLDGLAVGRITGRLDGTAGQITLLGLPRDTLNAHGNGLPSTAPPTLPLDRVSIAAISLRFADRDGELELRDSQLVADATGWQATAQLTGRHPLARLEGRLAAHLTADLVPEGTRLDLALNPRDPAVDRVTLTGGLADGIVSGQVRLVQHARQTASGDLALNLGNGQLSIDAFLAQADLAPLSGRLVVAGAASGHVRLAGNLTAQDVTGEAQLTLDQVAIAPFLSAAAGTLALDFSLLGSAFAAEITRPWSLGLTVEDRLHALLPFVPDDRRAAIIWTPDGNSPIAISADVAARTGLLVGGALAMTGSDGARIDIAPGRLQLNYDDGFAASGEDARITATGLQIGGTVIRRVRQVGPVGYGAGQWVLAGDFTAEIDHDQGSVVAQTLALSWQGSVSADEAGVSLAHAGCLRATAQTVQVAGYRISRLEPLCLWPSDSDLFRLDRGRQSLHLAFALNDQKLGLRLDDSAGRARPLIGRIGSADLTLDREGQDFQLSAAIARAAVTSAADRLAVAGVTGKVRLDAAGLPVGELRAAELRSLHRPALWVPLAAEFSRRADGASRARLSDASGAFVLEAVGAAARNQGRLDLTLYPIDFFPDVREFSALSPALGAGVARSQGRIGFAGHLAWGAAGVSSAGRLDLQSVGFSHPGATVKGVNARLAFTDLPGLKTAGRQQITIAGIDTALMMTEGLIDFSIDGPAAFDLHQARFAAAGGRLRAAPMRASLIDPVGSRLVLAADDLDLRELLSISNIEGLSGAGRLSGRLPLVWRADGLAIEGGLLDAGAAGELAYRPETLPDFLKGEDLQSEMLRTVLEDFHYEKLALAIDGAIGREQQMRFEARGGNPTFLDGHPIELNFAFNGPLINVVRDSVSAFDLDRLVRERDKAAQEGTDP